VIAAAFWLSFVVAQSAIAFNLLKYAGAAYLAYPGIRILPRRKSDFTVKTVTVQSARRALVDGLMVEALNVKTALFFLAFLPQFISTSQPMAPQLVLLGSICVALNTTVDVVAVFAVNRLLQSGSARAARARLMNRVSGVTMLGLGAFLALARRPHRSVAIRDLNFHCWQRADSSSRRSQLTAAVGHKRTLDVAVPDAASGRRLSAGK
jgi:threonine/homoserine/homoserine lactone efflux protein